MVRDLTFLLTTLIYSTMCSRMLLPLALLGISAFLYTVQAAPTAVATRGSSEIDTLGGGRVKRQVLFYYISIV